MEYRLLGSLVKRKIGYGIVQPGQSTGDGVPIIKVNNIISGLESINDLDTTSREISEKYSRTILRGGELIVSVVGTIGKTAIVPENFAGCNLVRAVALLDIEDKIISKWVKYYLDSPYGKDYISQNLNTTVQPTLNIKSLTNMPIPFYDTEYMEKTIDLLSEIDDKITLNNKINENLEQQAQALYREMFLENQNITTVTKTLNSIAVITMGQSPSGKSYNEDGIGEVFYQGRAEFGTRFPTRRLFTTEPKRMAEAGDVLLSVRAPVGDLNVAYEKCCIGRGLAAVHSKIGNNSFILYTMMASKPRFDVFNGEGTVFGSINRESLNTMPIEVPPMEMIVEFEDMAHPIDEMIRIRYEENCRLETLRDTLLPKLMNGEIDIEDVI